MPGIGGEAARRDEARRKAGKGGTDPWPPGRAAFLGATEGFRGRFALRRRDRIGTAPLDRLQALGKLSRAGEAEVRITFGCREYVGAQHRIGDPAFPAWRERRRKIADRQLIEYHAERIDIALHRRHGIADQFGGPIGERARPGLVPRQVGIERARIGDLEAGEDGIVEKAPASEIGQPDAFGALLGRNEDVRRLQILVQHTKVVHPRDRARDRRGDRQPRLDRDRRKPALPGGPSGQVLPAKAIFKKERRDIEIPFEERGKRRRFAQPCEQQPGQRGLALQAAKPVWGVGEFEHPRLAGLVVPRQPDVLRAAVAERLHQPPLPPTRHRIVRRECKARRQRRFDTLDRDRGGELVPDPRNRLDDLLARLTQGLAQFRDRGGQRPLHDGDARPDRVEDFVLGHNLACAKQQFVQHLEWLALERDRLTVHAQRPACFVELRPRELPKPAPAARRA